MYPYSAVCATALIQLITTTASQFLPPLQFQFPPGAMSGMHPQMMPANGNHLSPPEGMQNIPGSVPMPMSLPYSMQQPRVPLVVMPYHSKKRTQTKRNKKTRRRRRPAKKMMFDDSSSESESDSSGSGEFDFRTKGRHGKKLQVLTPVVSYVTKDGYVVYQKKIKREKARDWLELGRKKVSNQYMEIAEKDDSLETNSKTKFVKKKPGRGFE